MKKMRKYAGGGMPPIGDSVASGNRVNKQESAEDRKLMPPKKRSGMPPIGESVKSGNRVNRQESAEARKMGLKKGGKASCYAKGGSVTRADGIARKGHTKGKMV